MAIFFANNLDPIVGRQALLQTHPYAQPENGSKRAVRNGRGQGYLNIDYCVWTWHPQSRRGSDVYVRKVDDGQQPERDWVLRV